MDTQGLRELLGREVIVTGLIESKLRRDLTEAFEMGQASTYDIYASFGEEGVSEIVDRAEHFIKRIKELTS